MFGCLVSKSGSVQEDFAPMAIAYDSPPSASYESSGPGKKI